MGLLPPLKPLAVSMIIAFGGSFHFGYQVGITNPTEPAFKAFLNNSYRNHYNQSMSQSDFDLIWSLIVSLLLFGAGVGTLVMPMFADKIGRRKSLYITSAILLVGIALSTIANPLSLLNCLLQAASYLVWLQG